MNESSKKVCFVAMITAGASMEIFADGGALVFIFAAIFIVDWWNNE